MAQILSQKIGKGDLRIKRWVSNMRSQPCVLPLSATHQLVMVGRSMVAPLSPDSAWKELGALLAAISVGRTFLRGG